MKLAISRGQQSRLALILDEDAEGTISLEEYQNALEAYGQGVDKHIAADGSDYYVPFAQRALFKLIDVLKARGISYDDLYNMCDVNDDDNVNVLELEKVLEGVSEEFY